jgi:hypothetical protein
VVDVTGLMSTGSKHSRPQDSVCLCSPDASSLARDVNSLVDTDRHVLSNAAFVLGSAEGITRTTTLRKEIALALAEPHG